jgi:hypothetical protein
MKFLTFLILFITFRPNIDFLIVFVVVLYHFMSILNWLTFKRSAYVSIVYIDRIINGKIEMGSL